MGGSITFSSDIKIGGGINQRHGNEIDRNGDRMPYMDKGHKRREILNNLDVDISELSRALDIEQGKKEQRISDLGEKTHRARENFIDSAVKSAENAGYDRDVFEMNRILDHREDAKLLYNRSDLREADYRRLRRQIDSYSDQLVKNANRILRNCQRDNSLDYEELNRFENKKENFQSLNSNYNDLADRLEYTYKQEKRVDGFLKDIERIPGRIRHVENEIYDLRYEDSHNPEREMYTLQNQLEDLKYSDFSLRKDAVTALEKALDALNRRNRNR